MKIRRFLPTLAATAALVLAPVSAAGQLAGEWAGSLALPGGTSLRIVFHIQADEERGWTATMDSPDQGAHGIPVSEVALRGDSVRLAVIVAAGAWEGVLRGDTLSGTWAQGGMSFPLDLVRGAAPAEEPRRPQEPTGPLPYDVQEVTYASPIAGITLAGTLTLPRTPGPHPAALLISGSGPQDRDETLLGHKPFLVLADHLTRRGIAVLRVDDRGVGASEGDFAAADSRDFASDAEAGVRFLAGRPEVDAGAVGLIGHSEGGLVAPMVAAESDDVSWIVLLAGPGIPGDSILYLQGALIARASGAPEEAVRANAATQRKMFSVLEATPDDSVARGRLEALLAETLETSPGAAAMTPEQRRATAVQQARQVATPWFRFFLSHDPRPVLRRVDVPVLALNGQLDLQVPPRENLAAIAGALREGGNTRVTAHELPGLNHLFQTATTGAPQEYARIEETMSPAVLELVADWILGTTGRRANP